MPVQKPSRERIKLLRRKHQLTKDTPGYKQLRILRTALQMTQTDLLALLSDITGIPTEVSTLSRWETGVRQKPQRVYREALFQLLGIPVEAWNIREEQEGGDEEIESDLRPYEKPYPSVWNIPIPMTLFVGREDILQKLHAALQAGKAASLTQAITGLGGIGKTFTALQYAYRYREEYDAIWWVNASTYESIMSGFTKLAQKISKIPPRKSDDQHYILDVVKQWMKDTPRWLLIFDNVDESKVLQEFLSTARRGHIIFTSRIQIMSSIVVNVKLENLPHEEGATLLLRKAGMLDADESLDQAEEQKKALALHISRLMDGLPLALDQAGAYIWAEGIDLSEYIHLYEQKRMELLAWRSEDTFAGEYDYPYSVATTWSLSFERIEQAHPAAADLMSVYAFLAPDAIPDEIIINASSELGPYLSHITTADYFHKVVGVLLRYSFVQRNRERKTTSVHRLVQFVFKSRVKMRDGRTWVERVVKAMEKSFTAAREGSEPAQYLDRFVPHAIACLNLIRDEHVVSEESLSLLINIGVHLRIRAFYDEAQAFFEQARSFIETAEDATSLEQILNANFGMIYQGRKDFEQAEKYFLRAVTSWERTPPKDNEEHFLFAVSLRNLADCYIQQDKLEQAEPIVKRAISMIQVLPNAQLTDIASFMSLQARSYQEHQKYANAEKLYKQALAIHEQKIQKNDPEIAYLWNNLAITYAWQGRFVEAKELILRTLELLKEIQGAEHFDVAHSLTYLGDTCCSLGDLVQAESVYKQGLEIYEKNGGAEHIDCIDPLLNLAVTLLLQNRFEEAKSFYYRAIDVAKRNAPSRVNEISRDFSFIFLALTRRNRPMKLN